MRIIDIIPDQLKLEYALWNLQAVKEWVEREFGVILAINTMGDFLRRWGFTPQKPKKKAYEQCSEKVQLWLDQEYPAIVKSAKTEDSEIQWVGETALRNNCQTGRLFAPEGNPSTRMGRSKRCSVNMISSLTNQGKLQFMIYF